MESLGPCRICETAPLRWRRCGTCRRAVVLCDECDAAWRTADTTAKPTLSTDDDTPCPWCRASLLVGGSEWIASL